MARGSTLPAPRRGLRGAIAYRGGEGMVAWAFHRISGIAVSVFLTLHVVSIFMVGANPEFYNYIHLFYASAPGKVAEVLLGAALLYHALNGTRIVVMDLWPALTAYHRLLWRIVWITFFALGLPGAYIILSRIWETAK